MIALRNTAEGAREKGNGTYNGHTLHGKIITGQGNLNSQ